MIRAAAVSLFVLASPAFALDFTLPATARQTVERNTSPDTYAAPVDIFANGAVPTMIVEGDVQRSAWRLDSPGLTPFQVMRPLRAQLVEAGYEVVLDCAAKRCGGFDFRFATETLPGPNMYVNIRAFHFVTGARMVEGEVSEVVTVLASTSATSAYVQIIHAGAIGESGATVETTADLPVATETGAEEDFATRLLRRGHAVLSDLDFDVGSTELGAGPFDTLIQLAAFLEAQPTMRIALVGHTDTVGGLEPNISISRARARSVRQRLVDRYDVSADRMDAEGMGYLAPIASNLEAAGRDANRRVEVVLLGSE
ncbi:OmpA family protein [Sulfitobacter sp. JBTF-M27]|uniref:OmpA family protein n=1 Tax=Sulfitobacter sediminilitoris TaxID=2698830 RepID=A0A6P0CBQ8_9RHOB|nr:OmpA family protein [Sulfitobacter sediminilitoris]NEK21804.1 OmpA family protein [Sulfitobacter sediminilitoris]